MRNYALMYGSGDVFELMKAGHWFAQGTLEHCREGQPAFCETYVAELHWRREDMGDILISGREVPGTRMPGNADAAPEA